MTELEAIGVVVENVMNELLMRGGRADLPTVVRAMCAPGFPSDLTNRAIEGAVEAGLFMRLGSRIILCHHGWIACGTGSPATLGETP